MVALIDYDKEGNGDYYQVAKKRLKESALEPYTYEVDGETVLITSFSVPIIINDKFMGVTGVDYSLDKLQKEVDAISPMGAGQVGLISSGGNWVVGFHADTTGKTVSETEPAIAKMLADTKAMGKPTEMKLSAFKENVLTVMTPVDIGDTGQQWFVVVAIPTSVVLGPLHELSVTLIVLGLLAAGAMTVICWFVLRGLLRQPLRQIIHAISQIARNNFGVQLSSSKREDDIGTLAKAIEDYRNARKNEVDTQADRERQLEREKEVETRRKAELQELGRRFSTVVGGSGDADVEGGQPNFSSVATSTNEMFEAINSIARQMSQTQDTVARAVAEFDTVQSDFNLLTQSSEKINEVIGFIGEIASRTNLLSLNASIEAARAGEAGRGFSIVAEEVKNLAGLTTKATDSIAEQVQDVQAAISRSVGSIKNISATVEQINSANMTVAAAVEEQTNSTKEIASSVQYIKGQASDLLDHIRKG